MSKYKTLAIFLLMGLLCAQIAKHFYIIKKIERLKNPTEDSSPTTFNEHKGKTAVIFGDSRAKEWPSNLLGSEWRIVNLGIYGDTSKNMLRRFSNSIENLNPDIIILVFGINDIVTASLTSKTDRENIVQDCIANLTEIINKSRKTGAQTFVLEITPPLTFDLIRYFLWGDTINQDVDRVNRALKEAAPQELVSTQNILKNPDLAASDSLHYTPYGYKLLSLEINSRLGKN